MPHRLAALTYATILVASLTPGLSLASSPPYPPPTVDVLVNGTPRPQFPARGRLYIEALKGEEYAIRLRNPYPVRVAVALSVDGLNTIDARESTAADARKWVLGPYETVTISGWQTSRTQARRFEFTSEDRSYGAALGKVANLGVIEAVFFRERVPEPRYTSRAVPESPMPSPAMPVGAEGRNRADAQARSQAPAAVGASPMADDYAATGLGRRTDHAVRQVWLDLEDTPAASVSLRYEFRAQLVRLGVLPAPTTRVDPLSRRERARGFEPGFCPPPQR